jgi:hypothetical protein
MNRNWTDRDERLTLAIGRTTTRLSRRSFIAKATAAMAGGVAAVVYGPLAGKESAFASTFTCSPPCGGYCSGCSSSADCPAGHVNCTSSDSFGGLLTGHGCCTYASGWWYTAGAAGARHKCRDCRVTFCPCCCTSGCCSGFCGCRSTIHF